MRILFTVLVVLTVILGISVSAHAALVDIGGGLIYDDDRDITWLQDANYAQTSDYEADGTMTWATAMTWAEDLVYGGYTDWRLPTALNSDGTGPDADYSNGSEMGHLYYTELGNPAGGPLSNTGPFINVQPHNYWFGTVSESDPFWAWGFQFNDGNQTTHPAYYQLRAWAVRDGGAPSSVIPEPTTLSLLGLGLVGLVGFRKKERKL